MAKKISNSVFVVYGRNEEIRKSMFSFLRSLGLKPLQWEQIVKETGKASPYIGEVLDKGFEMAQAVVVIMTPDDEARLKQEFHGKEEKRHEVELTGQPRQNVLIEAGMALGRNADKTIIVEIGKMRDISNLLGRNVVRMDGTADKRNKLKNRLKTTGCEIDDSSEDWLSEGEFSIIESQEKEKSIKEKEEDDQIKETPIKQGTNEKYKGLVGGINLLVDEGFFNTVKTMKEVRVELESKGYVYPYPSVRKLVAGFAKKKRTLNVIRKKEGSVYVIRR